ncbi:MAG TPA: cytochrome P450 [Myxococcota bacterium]|nr:cytochrome P450 [Myxococcota bacterium]
MSQTAASSAPEIALGEPAFWMQPFESIEAGFAALRRTQGLTFHREFEVPFLPPGPGYWAVVRHADVLEVSRDAERFCSGRGTQISDMPEAFNEFFGSMINQDDPRHARLRRIVSSGFTPRMLKRVEADVERVAAQVIGAVAPRGECDFVTDLAAELPLRIICNLMGIPESQTRFVFDRTNVILGAGDPEYVAQIENVPAALLGAGAELAALVQDLGRQRMRQPTEDLTSALVHAELDGERLSDAELGSFFVLLVVAGNETTRNAISHGMRALCEHPAQRALWQKDFDALAPTAIEEIVRFATPVLHFRRTATRDTELAGQPIRAGDKLVLWYVSANRDESVFTDPHRFDIRRSPNEHVGFGGPGPHHCLGAHLARREITVMFRELFRRLPDLEITGPPQMLASNFIHGIKHMPCAFTPGGARPA